MLSAVGLLAQVFWSGLSGVPDSPLLPLGGESWSTEVAASSTLKQLTQGQPLTFLAYERRPVSSGNPTVTQVYPVRADVLAVEIETGMVQQGQQRVYRPTPGDRRQENRRGDRVLLIRNGRRVGHLVGANRDMLYTFDQFLGSDLDTRWADRLDSYRLTSASDDRFQVAQPPQRVFRKSKPTDVAKTPQEERWSARHTLYLQFSKPLETNQPYVLSFLGQNFAPVEFVYAPQQFRSEAVHVSHIGFRPADPVKVGFLSTWMGSGGPLAYPGTLSFWLLDDATDTVVYEGKARLSVAAETLEDPYRNYTQTDVFALDFHDFQTPGRYRLCVETVGCSFPFPIAENAWQSPFLTAARGLYHQRSGLAIGAPYSTYARPRAFHPADGVKVYQSRAPLINTKMGLGKQDAFAALTAGVTETVLPEAWGGYFDAADWDRRIQHLSVARSLLELAELFPSAMAELSLNIPESSNALPDVVDEALWGLDLFRRLQKLDGGIPGGIESAAHPRFGEASWQESLRVMAYAPDPWSSYLYAGVAAQAASALQNRAPETAAVYTESALQAMTYAEARYVDAPAEGWPHQVGDARNLAALELWRLTGRDRWHRLFLTTTVFRDAAAPLVKWKHHDQADAAFLYARLSRPEVDPQVQTNARNALLRQATKVAQLTQKTAFQWTKEDPRAPVGWGISWASPGESKVLVQAHYLTQEVKYWQAALRATQFALGANPENLVYTTGLGHRSPKNPLMIDPRIQGVDPPPGITVYGPMDLSRPNYSQYWFMQRMEREQLMFPAPGDWPPTESYVDVHTNVAMTEFTVFQSIGPAAYVWGYLAVQDFPKGSP